MARTDAVLKAIGGQISETDARRLILKKIYDIARTELDRYLNAEKRVLVRVVENLWEKYAIAADELESDRASHAHHDGRFPDGIGVPGMTVPDRWLIKPLADLAQVVMGQSPDSKYYSEEESGFHSYKGARSFRAGIPTTRACHLLQPQPEDRVRRIDFAHVRAKGRTSERRQPRLCDWSRLGIIERNASNSGLS